MISLLINTYDRYDNLNKILDQQLNYSCLTEIIVFNNGCEEIGYERHPKLKIVEANWDVGLRSRWILALLARQDCVFVQDDDLLVEECLFNTIYGHYLFDNDKLYGIFGRKVNNLGTYVLSENCTKEPDFILTRLACFHRRLLSYIIEAEDRILPTRFPTPQQFPHDDILLSYVSRSVYNKCPMIVPIEAGDITELDEHNGLHKLSDYMDRRRDVIKRCREVLLGETISYPEPIRST